MEQNQSFLMHNPASGSVDKKYLTDGSSVFLLLIAAFTGVLSSPKWGIMPFAWIAPLSWLAFSRLSHMSKKWLLAFPVLMIVSVLSSYDVAPFPIPVLIVLAVVQSLKILLVYLSDSWITRKRQQFLTTIYFPAAYVSIEYLSSSFGGGVWWSIANTQLSFRWLSQLASVTGLWGISFLIYWFASVLVWSYQQYLGRNKFRTGILIYFSMLASVLCFGFIRYQWPNDDQKNKVKVAGLSVPVLGFLENLYKDFCGKKVSIDPKTSISSSRLREITRAEVPFIETADSIRFQNGWKAMQLINDSLLALSQAAADKGAKIITWSEANALLFKRDEQALIERGKVLSRKNQVYLLMAMAVIHNGKILPDSKFLENEAVFIGPDGAVLNVFHKNHPVPMAEASIPGDGVIPVVETKYGRISTSICYDADFPIPMKQLGRKKSGLLLLPSGDWYAIAPYHAQMAIFRAIENGNSLLRQASGGFSIATDYRGKILGSLDYYQEGTKLWITELPIAHVPTLYTKIGDSFAYVCMGIMSIGWIFLLSMAFRKQTAVISNQENRILAM
ncbi:MAG: nitrilase-related carbon-nitrogen hydrolase [Chitinophagales bacterium]